ncbi:MAG: S8 family serine peptidase [Nocardioidaceae bacterium]
MSKPRHGLRLRGAALTSAALLLAGSLAGTAAGAATSAAPSGQELRSVVVTLRAGVDVPPPTGRRAERQRALVAALRARARTAQAPLLADLRRWRDQGQVTRMTSLWISDAVAVTATPAVISAIRARADVAAVRPDAIDLVPALAAGTDNQVAIGAPAAWASGQTGQGVVVASLDSGVDVTHPDLATRFRGGTGDWFDPYGQHPDVPTDLSGHGTATTGVLVGGDDSGLTIGTAPGATWIAARVFDDSGASTTSAVHQAFQWVLDPDGDPLTADAPRIVNASWSIGTAPSCNLEFQPDVQALRAAGILAVFPAGNFGPATSSSVSPGNYPESLSVGALLTTGSISGLSGRGPSDCGGRARPFPDVVAPGEDVLTADRYGLYQYASGTSVASPHAAGVLALLAGARPSLGADALVDVLTSTAVDLGTTGPDEVYGSGRVDAVAALAALPPPPPPPDQLLFSTRGATNPAGVVGTADDSDVYRWDGTATQRDLDVSTLGVPASADVDGLDRVDATHLYVSFDADTWLPGPGRVQDEDVVRWDGTQWSLFFNGTAHGLTSDAADVDAITTQGTTLFFSTAGDARPPGVPGTPDDADVYRWDRTSYARVWDATRHGLAFDADLDGLVWTDSTHLAVSFRSTRTTVPQLGTVQDEDVVMLADGAWSLRFRGSDLGLAGTDALDIDAFDLP